MAKNHRKKKKTQDKKLDPTCNTINTKVIELENFTNQRDEIALADRLCEFLSQKRICPWRFLLYSFITVKELWWIDYLNDEELYNSDTLIYFLKFCRSLEIL
ncbi:hypothetical protein Dsin_004118 [Dipteronia sinensis]|uniref:Uncharacterized protein n=1 Tax=Dipteronia sinensis TaxID=43782 RepID=A0AAE0ELK5_9ROSI|nr:hypothetical protein Dsin_004118 [Dipteronia sinensis]